MVLADHDLLDFVEKTLHQGFDFRAVGVLHRFLLGSRLGQNGDTPIELAAFSIGTAKPMPMNTRCCVGLRMAVTMPTR